MNSVYTTRMTFWKFAFLTNVAVFLTCKTVCVAVVKTNTPLRHRMDTLVEIARRRLDYANPLFKHLRQKINHYSTSRQQDNVIVVGSFGNDLQLLDILENGTYIIEIDLMFERDSAGFEIPVMEKSLKSDTTHVRNPTIQVSPVKRGFQDDSKLFVWLNITQAFDTLKNLVVNYGDQFSTDGPPSSSTKRDKIDPEHCFRRTGYQLDYSDICPATETVNEPNTDSAVPSLGQYYYKMVHFLENSVDRITSLDGFYRQIFSLLVNSVHYFYNRPNDFYRLLTNLVFESIQNFPANTILDEYYRHFLRLMMTSSVADFRDNESRPYRQLLGRFVDSVLYLHGSLPLDKFYDKLLDIMVNFNRNKSWIKSQQKDSTHHDDQSNTEMQKETSEFFLENNFMRDNIPHSQFDFNSNNGIVNEAEVDLWLYDRRSFRTFKTDEYSWSDKHSKYSHEYSFRCLFDKEVALKLPWPKSASDWLKRHREWPSYNTAKDIVQNGCHVVPETSDSGSSRDWKYSFVLAEQSIMKLLTEQQRIIFLIFKQLKLKYLSSTPLMDGAIVIPSGLTTYHLNTIMMWVCEQRVPSEWESDPFESMVELLTMLLNALKEQKLQHYFIPEENIFARLGHFWERKDQVMYMNENLKSILKQDLLGVLIQIVEDIIHFPEAYLNVDIMSAVNENQLKSLDKRFLRDPIFIDFDKWEDILDRQ